MAPRSRIPQLDGVRGTAILLILLLHSFGFGVVHSDAPVWRFFNAFWVGVDLFFVLSGYLITGILLRTRHRPNYFRNFFARRVLRIFPPYYAAIGIVLLLGFSVPALRNERFGDLLRDQVWLWTYTTNIEMTLNARYTDFGWYGPGTWYFLTHLWSLAVEEQFYLLWPFVVALCRPKRLALLTGFLFVGAACLRFAFVQSGNFAGAYMFTLSRSDLLAAGALLAVLESQGRLVEATRWAGSAAWASLAAIFSLAIWRGAYSNVDPWIVTVGYSLNVVFFTSILAIALTRPPAHLMVRFFRLRPLIFMGKYSYSVYICHIMLAHPFIYHLVHFPDDVKARVGSIGVWLALILVYTLVTSYTVAFLSWHVFEKRFLALKKYFPYAD